MSSGLVINRPQRWDNPFVPDMTDADVDRIMDLETFRDMDTSKFSRSFSLRDIIRNTLVRGDPRVGAGRKKRHRAH